MIYFQNMEARHIFKNLSPLDHRYYLANQKLFDSLALYFSEEASVRYCIMAEAALLKALLAASGRQVEPQTREAIDKLSQNITPGEVYEEEAKTQHNIRALVHVIKKRLPPEIHSFVHLGATSVDILDTAKSAAWRDGAQKVVLPLLIEVEEQLIRLTRQYADQLQVGRTHGQFAVPITLGFTLAEYVSRLGKSVEKIADLSGCLKGKLAGAVGAYNATSVITGDPQALEADFLKEMGLKAAEHSTQMVEPEPLLRLLLEINIAFGVIANLADDLRHLQRSEIGEVQEYFGEKQVGSSTMPQKRNPWNCEHVKSLWKAFAPRVVTFYMDQISEHQRDLTNSASTRFAADFIAGFCAAAARLGKVLKRLKVDREGIERNLKAAGDLVLAEAAYIILGLNGEGEAHETIRQATLKAQEPGRSLAGELKKETRLWDILDGQLRKVMSVGAEQFFTTPGLYCGKARQKALSVADIFTEKTQKIKARLKRSA